MSKTRSAARLAACQALYQHEMEGTAIVQLLHEFHQHRLGATIEDVDYMPAEHAFFDDIVKGVLARTAEIDAAISERLAKGWSFDRIDKLVRQILRAGAYELIARNDIPVGSIIGEYLDVADAFYGKKEKAFINGVLDGLAKDVRDQARR